MPRPLWTGSLNFGLVNVPVRLTSAVRDLDLHFRQLHASDDTAIETRRVCSKDDEEVPVDEWIALATGLKKTTPEGSAPPSRREGSAAGGEQP